MDEYTKTKDYWNLAHREENLAALSGHSLELHLDFLGIKELFATSERILCIGIGTGSYIREAVEIKGPNAITAMDISSAALAKIANIASVTTSEIFYAGDIHDHFDLAMSFWVAPHMRKSLLGEQIRAVVRSLRGAGIFALHYNEPAPGTSFSEDEFIARFSTEADALSSGLMRITRAELLGMTAAAGGKAMAWPRKYEVPDYDEVCYSVHIGRENPL